MTWKLAGIVAGLWLVLPAAHAESRATLEACIARVSSVATGDAGISPEQRALAKAIQKFGSPAIPPLLNLLKSQQAGVSELAGYTLRHIDGLTPAHLAPLMDARRNGNGWIPIAIARIGTPEAVDFLINDLRMDPETETQVTSALQMLGAKAAPGVANLLKCTEACDENVARAAVFVLSEMGKDAAATVPSLLQIASDEKFALSSRQSAIDAVGEIGRSSQPYVSQLIALKDRVPALESSVNSALASIGTSEAVPPLLQSLAADPQTALKRIADLGSNGYSAGPKVMEYLGDPRWDVRVAAAGALGRISYTPAESALQMALSDQDDWKLVYSAVIALGHLKSGASIEALKRVRDSHWYPPVRERASSVIEQIKTGSPAKESGWWQYAKLDDAPESCTRVAEKTVVESKERKLYSNPDLFDLARLAREAAKRTYGPEVGRDSDKNGSTSTFDKRRQIPQVALKVQDGWLGGTDHGEWGGELIYMPASGANVVLAEKNTRDIFLLGDQLVAITGLAHLGMNDGMLLRVDRDALGGFVATPWKRLPAAPDTSKLVEGGVLLVNSQGAGSISIDRSGKIRMATCL